MALKAHCADATVILVVISSDKTQLTLFHGKTAYPMYMTIGPEKCPSKALTIGTNADWIHPHFET